MLLLNRDSIQVHQYAQVAKFVVPPGITLKLRLWLSDFVNTQIRSHIEGDSSPSCVHVPCSINTHHQALAGMVLVYSHTGTMV